MIVKVTKSSATWHVTINGQTINLATWDGNVVTQIQAIEKAQRIIVAQHEADNG
jgi:hypothetical protein